MSEQPYAPAESDALPADFDDAFDDWIGGATISKRAVPIYAKPGLFAEYEELQRELDMIEDAEQGEAALGDGRAEEINDRMSEIYEEWQASKSTWIVRALDDSDYDDINEGVEVPEALEEPVKPEDLLERHSIADERQHKAAMEKYESALADYKARKPENDKALAAYKTEMNLRIAAKAVVEIRFNDGRTKSGVTVDEMRRLKDKLGNRQILSLMNATQLATYQEPDIPAPFSQRTSEDDQT